GNPVKVIDPNGNVCKAEYDAIGRVVSRTDELGNISKLEYTATGKVKSKTDFSGKKIEYSYDKRGKIINIFFNGSLKEHFIYDEMGRLSEKSYPDGLKVKCTYTANNQISHIETSTGRTIDYVYDSFGRCISQNDCGNSTHYAYTETGNLEKITDAEGNITEYTYNALDILSSVYRHGNEDKNMSSIDGEKLHITSYEHDSSGKLTCITDALGQKELYEYDNFGRLKTKTDRDKLTTSYSYTKMGQLSEIVYADGKTVKMSYDALGKLSELVDWMGKTSIVSDALGRVVKVTDFNNRTIEYEYTPFGKRSAVIYSDGRRVCYQYDENLQLIKLVNENGTEIDETDYEYDEFGRLTAKIFPNGASSRYEYYQGGLLKSLINNDVNGILDSYTYEYNNVGLKTKVTRSRRGMEDISGQYNYIYDCLNRIKSILFNGSSIKKYSYDAFGNRSQMEENHNGKVLTTTYSYDITDRLRESKEYSFESIDPNYSDSIIPIEKRYTYDARGNMTGIIRDGVKTKSYFFDATGMMTGASDIERGNITYSYNGLGFRVKSERPEEKIEYLCDITRKAYNLLERTVNGVTESYVYDRNVVSFSRKNESSYYLQDDLGSTNWMTGTDGTVYESYAYEDFGKQIDKNTKDIKTGRRLRNLGYEKNGNIIQPFAFTGYQRDEISELYYAQARYYNQDIGRFVAEDQERGLLFFPDSQNHYIYCYNCVFDYVDLNGRAPIIFPSDPILRMALSEILHNGNTAHKDIEADLMLKYGDEYNIETNVFIEGSRPNTGTTDNGFADLVMNPVGTNNYYIYEIKSDKNTDGITQLGEYVEGLKNAILKDLGIGKFKEIDKDSNVYYGNLNIPETTIPSSRKGYTLTYWSDADGMIYYHWNKEPQKQKQTQTAKAPATQKATGFARVCQGIYGAGEMFAGAACYTFCGLLVLDDGTVVGVADDPAAFAAGAAGTYLWIDGWNKIIGNCPY
ncbi:MAG: RHS repeat protein, partial [Lachnospiraceae bacterium]|nr:RHS repeat protein [Lachnospiraceae bacterium]